MRNVPALLLTAFSLFLFTGAATAAPAGGPVKVVVVPIVVGNAPEPDSAFLAALADGLRSSARWNVEYGGKGRPFQLAPAAEDGALASYADRLADAARLLTGNPAAATSTLETLWADLLAAGQSSNRGTVYLDLLYRAGGLLVGAHRSAGNVDKAQAAAQSVALLFPGRKPADRDQLPADAAEVLASVQPSGEDAARLVLKTRPEGCGVLLNGQTVAAAPTEIPVLRGGTYQVQAVCTAGTSELRSFPRSITIAKDEVSRTELVDASFVRSLENGPEGGRLRFSSSEERRALEESYARRTADALGADLVVFASIGELGGADFLYGRLYLKSGFLNRQGLVRIELPRATALGTYLATGKEMPGVVRREDAAVLAARPAETMPTLEPPGARPWYTDVPGWALTGVGAVGVVAGLYLVNKADDRSKEADGLINDPFRKQDLQKQSQSLKFWADIGLLGGAVMGITGIVLLATPEYTSTKGELFAVTPLPGGGAAATLRGRF